MNLRYFLSGLSDILFPPSCVHCGGLTESSEFDHLCAKCSSLLSWAKGPCCTTCGHPFYGEVTREVICVHCEELDAAFAEGRTVLLLKGPSRTFVHYLKYRKGLYLHRDIQRLFRRQDGLADYIRDAWLVPVPLSWRKRRERGYNQSRILAEALAAIGGNSTRIVDLLKKTIDTPSQTIFDRKARQRNLKNAFSLIKGADLIPHQKIILIDDVFTTGSTLNACARQLRRAGCLNLNVLTLGHG